MTASPYMDAREAAAYVKAPSLKSFNHWVTRRGVPVSARRGRVRLYRKDVLDRILAHDAVRRTP